MQTIVKSVAIDSAAWIDTNASSTLARICIGGYKDFDIVVQLSGSHGLAYTIYTAPVNDPKYFTSKTGGTIASGIHAANIHHFPNNNMNHMLILGSATAINSASLINVFLSTISEDK